MNDQPAVLYVEDDPLSRRVMSMLLAGRLGLSDVTIFDDSTDFEARVDALDPKPDIVFLDIQVEPYDGFAMLDMLRRMEWVNGTPIIALTASVMNEEVQQLRTAGFNGCLAKPLDLSTFQDTFQRLLAGEVIWRIEE